VSDEEPPVSSRWRPGYRCRQRLLGRRFLDPLLVLYLLPAMALRAIRRHLGRSSGRRGRSDCLPGVCPYGAPCPAVSDRGGHATSHATSEGPEDTRERRGADGTVASPRCSFGIRCFVHGQESAPRLRASIESVPSQIMTPGDLARTRPHHGHYRRVLVAGRWAQDPHRTPGDSPRDPQNSRTRQLPEASTPDRVRL
jgi:hypothetical protein